ncbi:MAG: hypothetical protein INR68_05370 [Methylobacterium mesophilicum]|nr:hypothetical protein [Methylobacterium mesophilicum]
MSIPIIVAPEALTITWLAVGGLVIELFVLIVFLVRVAWWLSHRFTAIDAGLGLLNKDVAQLKADVGNDIAGRKVVAETKNDLVEMKTALRDMRERVGRLENHEDGRRAGAPGPMLSA